MRKKNLSSHKEKMAQQYVYPPEIDAAKLNHEGSIVEAPGVKALSKINPDQQSYTISASGKKAIFTFPNTVLNFRDSFLSFTAKASKTGGTYIQFPKFTAEAMFERIRVLIGSKVIMDCDNIDVWMTLNRMGSSVSSAAYNTIDQVADGTTTATMRTATANGQKYILNFPGLEILNNQFFPNNLQAGLLTIELYFQDPNIVCTSDGSAPVITVQDLHWHIQTYSGIGAGYDSALASQVSQGLALHYRAPEHQSYVITASGQSQFSLNFRTRRARSIWCVLRTQSRITDLTQLNKAASYEGNVSGGFEVSGDCFLRLNTNRYPLDNIELNTIAVDGSGSKYEFLAQTLQCFRREWKDNDPRLALQNGDAYFVQQWNDSAANLAGFIMAWDLTLGTEDDCYSAGVDLSGNVSQTLSLTLSNVSANIQLDVYCFESKLMIVDKNGVTTIYD